MARGYAIGRVPITKQLYERKPEVTVLYINPLEHAAVFCVDEETAIQALDRLVMSCGGRRTAWPR
jgi:hypothetical protein